MPRSSGPLTSSRSSTVINWLGGFWGSALERAHLPAAPGGDSFAVMSGPRFTEEEAIAALKACQDDLGHVPSLTEYRRWSASAEVKARPGRPPQSQYAIARLFGSWLDGLRAAGMVGDAPSGALNVVTASHRPSNYRFTVDQLREAAEKLGRSPRSAEYTRLRDDLQRAEARAGKPVIARPSYNVVNRIYETWDAALVDAGLEPLGGRATSSNPRRGPVECRFSDEDGLQALRRCVDAYDGDPVTIRLYDRWRREQPDARNLPSSDTVRRRIKGRWEKLVAQVIQEREQ